VGAEDAGVRAGRVEECSGFAGGFHFVGRLSENLSE
jgi:hypothetical protein